MEMKVECLVCGNVGILEQRGNSQRIVHYTYVEGKRTFTKHLVSMGTTVGTDGNRLGTENIELSSMVDNRANLTGSVTRSVASGATDPGSNPGSPTIDLPFNPELTPVCSMWLFFES
jgi:hypothetical protein